MKTVDDHCGFILSGNPFQMIFQNNAREWKQTWMEKLTTATRGDDLCVQGHL